MLDTEYVEEYKELADSAVDPKELLLNHLTAELTMSYMELLEKNRHLYDRHLGRMRFDYYILPLSPEYKPVHVRPYLIFRSQDNAARVEIQCRTQLDVLKQIYD